MKRAKTIFFKTLFYLLVIAYIFLEEAVWERFVRPVVRFLDRHLFSTLEKSVLSLSEKALLPLFVSTFIVAELAGIAAAPAALVSPLFGATLYGFKIVLAGFALWIYRKRERDFRKHATIRFALLWILRFKRYVTRLEIYRNVKRAVASIKAYLKREKSFLKRFFRYLKRIRRKERV